MTASVSFDGGSSIRMLTTSCPIDCPIALRSLGWTHEIERPHRPDPFEFARALLLEPPARTKAPVKVLRTMNAPGFARGFEIADHVECVTPKIINGRALSNHAAD